MTSTQLTVETAPRDAASIEKIGRFNCRTLANDLGVFTSEQAKQTFMGLSVSEQAKVLEGLLKEHDGKKNGKGAAAASGTSAPPRTPSNKGKTGKGSAAPAATTASNEGGTAGGASVNAAALLGEMKALREAYEAMVEQMTQFNETVQGLTAHAAGTNGLVSVSVSLSLLLAEQVLNAPPEAVLQEAINQLPSIKPALEAIVSTGGGGDEDEETEEADEEEGNE